MVSGISDDYINSVQIGHYHRPQKTKRNYTCFSVMKQESIQVSVFILSSAISCFSSIISVCSQASINAHKTVNL